MSSISLKHIYISRDVLVRFGVPVPYTPYYRRASPMKTSIRNRYFFVSDILLLPCAAYLSYVLRLEDLDIAGYLPGLILFTGLSLLTMLFVFIRFGIYARYWSYASIE